MAARPLTESDFDTAVADADVAIVDFWAPWCGPCRTMAPDLERVAAEHRDDGVLVAKVNVDEQRELGERYRVMSVPTLLVFREGQLVDRFVGATPAAGLRTAIRDASAPPRRGVLHRLLGREPRLRSG